MLLVLGLLHATLFWTGDVLHVYAVLGFVLVLGLRRVSDRTLFALIGACLVYPLMMSLLRVAFVTQEFTKARVAMFKSYAASNDLAFGQGGYGDAVQENLRLLVLDYGSWYQLWGMSNWYVSMTLTMLIGVIAGRRRWAQRAAELMPQIERLTWVMLALGLTCGAISTAIWEANRTPGPSLIKTLAGLLYNISRPAMMVFYVLLIVQLIHRPGWRRYFKAFEAAGRMPLTNYLMQTLICTTLFYNWGFGLWAQVGPAVGLALSLAIFFVVQVPWSLWWLKHHERGPMEALWARLTYGRKQPALAAAAAPGPTAARP